MLKIIFYYLFIFRLPHSRYLHVFNRIRLFYICKIMGIMEPHHDNYFENNIYIGNGKNVRIGKHCHINENCFIQGATIGDHVMIAPNVSILNSTHNHTRINIPIIHQGKKKDINPVIENDVWIGRNVLILPGVKIKTGCIVGAGAVVTKDTQPFSIIGGNPAKLIRKRNNQDK